MSRVPVNVVDCQLMIYSNVIVGITISRGSFVFSQSRVKVIQYSNYVQTILTLDDTFEVPIYLGN